MWERDDKLQPAKIKEARLTVYVNGNFDIYN